MDDEAVGSGSDVARAAAMMRSINSGTVTCARTLVGEAVAYSWQRYPVTLRTVAIARKMRVRLVHVELHAADDRERNASSSIANSTCRVSSSLTATPNRLPVTVTLRPAMLPDSTRQNEMPMVPVFTATHQ